MKRDASGTTVQRQTEGSPKEKAKAKARKERKEKEKEETGNKGRRFMKSLSRPKGDAHWGDAKGK